MRLAPCGPPYPEDPDDAKQGDCWDHVAFDPEHKLVVSVVPGKRTAENVDEVVKEFHDRTGGRVMDREHRRDRPEDHSGVHFHHAALLARLVHGRVGVAKSVVSSAVNIAFVERQNGTDRNRNSRKVRKSCCFSKDWDVHAAVTYFRMYSCNLCWAVRTLRVKGAHDRRQQRNPAMSAGLAEHVWSLREWLTFPAVQQE